MRLSSAINALIRRQTEAPAAAGGSGNTAVYSPGRAAVSLISARTSSSAMSREFSPPDIDIDSINMLYNNEAFARRAVDKHIELMFKAGWDFVGEDPRAVEYIKKRMYLIAEMTKIPTSQLFTEIAEDLVKYSNAVVIKVRKDMTWPRGLNVRGINGLKPVVGYFPVNLSYVEVQRDNAGNILRWRVNFPGADKPVEFRPEDVIHFYYKREKNQVFAVPYLNAVVEDINALRQVEESVLKLIYRNLYPFLHHIVGSEKDGQGGTDEEVQAVYNMIENMDLEAGLVTTERHRIVPIALDDVIDANNYLRYFEQRVFTGLGVSETVMGRSGSASRATAESQYFDLRETVRAIQRTMETFVDEFILKELLYEGGIDPFVKPNSSVHFRFREIDLDMKIKYENHIIYQYLTNCITEDEMRAGLGLDPISDRSKIFCNLVTIPIAQATGKKEEVSSSEVASRSETSTRKEDREDDSQLPVRSTADMLIEAYNSAVRLGHEDPERVAKEVNRSIITALASGAGFYEVEKLIDDIWPARAEEKESEDL